MEEEQQNAALKITKLFLAHKPRSACVKHMLDKTQKKEYAVKIVEDMLGTRLQNMEDGVRVFSSLSPTQIQDLSGNLAQKVTDLVV